MNYQEDQAYGPEHNNRKKIIAILVILVIVAVACIVLFNRKTPEAPPTAEEEALDFTWIKSVEDFQLLKDSTGKFKLANDIDFSGVTVWESIVFAGELDGNGHRLLNVAIPCLFNENNGTIKNLTLSNFFSGNISVDANTYVGLVQYNNGTISHCSVTQSTVSSAYTLGFFAYYNAGTIEDCSVTSTSILERGVEGGGIAIMNETSGKIFRCYTDLTLNVHRLYFGGIVKINCGTVSTCYSRNRIDANVTNFGSGTHISANVHAGGIAADNDARIEECYSVFQLNAVAVAQNDAPTSGMLGTKTSATVIVGGLTGNNLGEIVNCFADVNLFTNVDGKDKNSSKELTLRNNTGYLHGNNISEFESGTLQNSYYSQSSAVSAQKQDKTVAHNEDGIQASATDPGSQSFCTGTLGWNADNWVFSSSGFPTLQ